MNPWVGWSVTALLSWLLVRDQDGAAGGKERAGKLNASQAQVGTPVPVIMGRMLFKGPLIIYYGDFRADIYTETYASHAKFSAWPVILTMLLEWTLKPVTGQSSATHTHKAPDGTTGPNTPNPIPVKEKEGPKYLMALAQWLLAWLINGRNLKTTVQKGFKYFLGYQLLACVSGQDIRLRAVYLGAKKVWEGNVRREDHPDGPFVLRVDNEELFGGPDEGGGFVGDLRFYLGGPDQPADSWMENQMTAETVQEELRGLTPAYRPFISLVVPTAYIGKQATIPVTWLDLQWIPNRLGLGAIGEDANPAEVLYEMHVNSDWGLNRDPTLVNAESLLAVGTRLRQEGLGITVPITSKTEVRDLIDDICNHLDMVRYTDPETGKLTFKLIRDDYDATNLPIFDETICKSVSYTRTVWTNTSGQVSAVYTDRAAQYDTSTVTANDPANIEINDGNMNSADCDFRYFTSSGNALWAAQRELRQRAFPLAAATLICNRKASFLRNGDVIKLNWPPYGIKDLILRVTDVDLGDFVTGEVTVECVEDVFGLGKAKYGSSDSTEWVRPINYPTGVQVFQYFEAPWELMQTNDSFVFALAAVPDSKTQKWTVWRKRDSTWETTSSMIRWTPVAQLVADYPEDGAVEDVTGFEILDMGGIYDLAGRSYAAGTPGFGAARSGSRLLMAGNEIMGWGNLVQLPNGHWRVQNVIRATYDTVPAGHRQGDVVYFLDAGYYANVTTGGAVCPAGTTVAEAYNITTATVDKTEAFDNAKVTALATVRRAARPAPPGRIRMAAHLHSDAPRIGQAAGDLSLAWVLRNKRFSFGCVAQDDTADYFTGLAVSPEDRLQTAVEVYAGGERIHREVFDNTATGFDYSWAQRCLDKPAFDVETRVEIFAILNGLESYQRHTRTFTWKPPYILAGCQTEAEALPILRDRYRDGGMLVTFEDEADNRLIPVVNMPLVVLGAVYETEQPGALFCQDGKWVVPGGTVLAVTGRDTYNTVPLANGYVVVSYYAPEEPGRLCAYRFDGTAFTRIAVPAV
ncbi:MAG TPA: phage tail protein [Selenomonadales bacterium]|nr:phage tail protein [Selenomonadales bacterium]